MELKDDEPLRRRKDSDFLTITALSVNLRLYGILRFFGYRKWTSVGRVGYNYSLSKADSDDAEVARRWLNESGTFVRFQLFGLLFGLATFRTLAE